MCMISSARASTASAIRKSASERSEGVLSRHSSNAVAAASIARSTSAGPDKVASAYCSPVAGSMTGEVRPSLASTHSPLTKFLKDFMAAGVADRNSGVSQVGPPDRSFTAPSVRHDKDMADPVITTVGVPKEIKTLEHRVAMTPDGVRELERHGINVYVERGAGEGASISDENYR